jgi:UDP-N-acetylmuramoyl-tripeptide--D-alanyl-D-alanine ligase
MEAKALHQLFLKCNSVSTDTRKIAFNSLFFCLKGDKFDANTFAQEALKKGASYVIIDNEDYFVDDKTIVVKDTLETLQELANYHRKYLKLPIIALTGSNGKTTTKELLNAVLSEKYNVKATVGNLNNHIGVPLTLLSFDQETEIGIVEMGANHQKEIEFLCDLAEPDFGYITNFGKAHLEGFGGIEGVIKGKSEMYHFLKNHNGKVFVNLDDAIQVKNSDFIFQYSFSSVNRNADVFTNNLHAKPFVSLTFNNQIIQSQLVGIYNATNISAAITIGHYFKVADNLIKKAIENYNPTNNRSQLSNKGSNQLILDAYNANPSSMKVALENFCQIPEQSKITFLGDMFELGNESFDEHKELIESLKKETEIQFYFVGREFYEAKIELSNFYFFATFEELKEAISQLKFDNNYILIKGSRGMALERIVDLL